MVGELNTWFGQYEPIWLFIVLVYEAMVGTITLAYIVMEYNYDARKDLEKSHKMKRSKKSVKIVVEDGQARVVEAPKDIDVTLEQRADS